MLTTHSLLATDQVGRPITCVTRSGKGGVYQAAHEESPVDELQPPGQSR